MLVTLISLKTLLKNKLATASCLTAGTYALDDGYYY